MQAAGRHQCSYLIEQQASEFRHAGGDPGWLQGLECIPGKLRDLYEINKILAHRPWLITKDHIEVPVAPVPFSRESPVSARLILLPTGPAQAAARFGAAVKSRPERRPAADDL